MSQEKPVYEISPSVWGGFSLGELFQYRHLAIMLAVRLVRARYKQTVLGLLWAVAVPVAFTAIFIAFFQIANVKPAGDVSAVLAIFSGMVMWQLFTRGVSEGSVSLTSNSNLITKVYFPRIVLPISAILSALFDMLISFVLLAVLLIWYGVVPSGRIVFLPLFVGQVILITLSVAIWLSAIDGIYRDLRHALPLLLQLGMFVSPVAYTTSSLISGNWRWLYEFNPLVAPLEGFRWVLLPNASQPTLDMLMKSTCVTGGLLISSVIFFARVEKVVVDRV